MTLVRVQDQVREITAKLTFGCGCFSCSENARALTALYDLLRGLIEEEDKSNQVQRSLTTIGRRKIGGDNDQ